jgi:hypothetical protein
MPEPYDRAARQELVWMTKNAKSYAMKDSTPNDPAVNAAIDLVRWELSLGT